MQYSISILSDQSRIPEVITLFRTGLGETSIEHWVWRLFSDNGQEDRPFAVIAEDETGRMAGISTVIPTRYGTSRKKCVSFGDWVVHPNDRGQGLIRKIFDFMCDYFSQRGYDFMLTFPNENSYPILRRYGFADLTGVSSWNSVTKPFALRRQPNSRIYQGISYRFSERCPLTTLPNPLENRLFRTPEYLSWKYDQNPDVTYAWLTLWQDSDLLGYFVYTLTKGRLRTAVNVYDWDYYSTQDAPFRYAISLLRGLGSFVSFWGIYSGDLLELLKQSGLQSHPGKTKCIVRPMQPEGLPDQLIITRADTDY